MTSRRFEASASPRQFIDIIVKLFIVLLSYLEKPKQRGDQYPLTVGEDD